MRYCISDIHGEYDLFCRLLEKIKFCASDKLIVCGDLIDKGDSSVKVVQLVRQMPNAVCVMGNHEYDLMKVYRAAIRERDGTFLDRVNRLFPDRELLNENDLDWMNALPSYIEFDDCIATHAGLPVTHDGKIMKLCEAKEELFVYNRRFYEPGFVPELDKCVLYGHTPTRYVCGVDRILRYPKIGATGEEKSIGFYNKIHLDTGVYLGGVLGCINIDAMQAFYVQKNN